MHINCKTNSCLLIIFFLKEAANQIITYYKKYILKKIYIRVLNLNFPMVNTVYATGFTLYPLKISSSLCFFYIFMRGMTRDQSHDMGKTQTQNQTSLYFNMEEVKTRRNNSKT